MARIGKPSAFAALTTLGGNSGTKRPSLMHSPARPRRESSRTMRETCRELSSRSGYPEVTSSSAGRTHGSTSGTSIMFNRSTNRSRPLRRPEWWLSPSPRGRGPHARSCRKTIRRAGRLSHPAPCRSRQRSWRSAGLAAAWARTETLPCRLIISVQRAKDRQGQLRGGEAGRHHRPLICPGGAPARTGVTSVEDLDNLPAPENIARVIIVGLTGCWSDSRRSCRAGNRSQGLTGSGCGVGLHSRRAPVD